MALSSRTFLLVLIIALVLFTTRAHAFGAGNIASISAIEGKNWRHGDIEDLLKQVTCIKHHKWNSMMIKRAYFGNWLRDYSQAMDTGALKKANAETIRILVWLLSFLGFGYATAEFEVTSQRLGVYRPEEHIDNPKNYNDDQDARPYDARLRGPVRPVELEIDPQTGMKNYIANGRGDWATSAAFVKYSFTQSIHHGRQYTRGSGTLSRGKDEDLAEALRLLGQGLHTLEDFGAHTNYVELALIELGYRDVFPLVGRNTQVNVHGKHIWPLVTGTFGMVDFYHSVLGEATDHFTQSEVNEMDNAMGVAEQAASSSNPLSTLVKLLSKIPGTGGLADEAQKLQAASQAEARRSLPGGGSRSIDDYSGSRGGDDHGSSRGLDDYSSSRAGPGDFPGAGQYGAASHDSYNSSAQPPQPGYHQGGYNEYGQQQSYNQGYNQSYPSYGQPTQPAWSQPPAQPQWPQPQHDPYNQGSSWNQPPPPQHSQWQQPPPPQPGQYPYPAQHDNWGQGPSWQQQPPPQHQAAPYSPQPYPQSHAPAQPQQPPPQHPAAPYSPQPYPQSHAPDQPQQPPQHQAAPYSPQPYPQSHAPAQPQQPTQTPQAAPAPPQGLPGLPNFDTAKTIKQIYPILAFRDKVVRSISAIIEKIPGLEALVDRIVETLTVFIFSLLAPFVRPILKALQSTLQSSSEGVTEWNKKHQYEVWDDPSCSDPTHSMLSKDHFSNILNEPAGAVAGEILKFIAPRVLYAWEHPEVPVDRVMQDIDGIFHHPALRNEHGNECHRNMFNAVRNWAKGRRDIDSLLNMQAVRQGKNHKEGVNDHAGHGSAMGAHPQPGSSGGASAGYSGGGSAPPGGYGAYLHQAENVISGFTGIGQHQGSGQQHHGSSGQSSGGLGGLLGQAESFLGGGSSGHGSSSHGGGGGGGGGGLNDMLSMANKLPGVGKYTSQLNTFNKLSSAFGGGRRGLDDEQTREIQRERGFNDDGDYGDSDKYVNMGLSSVGGANELYESALRAERPQPTPSPGPMAVPSGYEQYSRGADYVGQSYEYGAQGHGETHQGYGGGHGQGQGSGYGSQPSGGHSDSYYRG